MLQEDQVHVRVVRAIESVSKTKKSLDKLKSTAVEELTNVNRVLTRITRADDGSVAYQGVELKAYERGLTYLKSHYIQWIDAAETCLRDLLISQDTELLAHAVTLLANYGNKLNQPRLDMQHWMLSVKDSALPWRVPLLTVL